MTSLRGALRRLSTGSINDTPVSFKRTVLPDDPKAESKEVVASQQIKIQDWLRRGLFKVVLEGSIPPDFSVLPRPFFLATKSKSDRAVKCKARDLISGHRNKMKHRIMHSAITLQPQTVRNALALATLLNSEV